MTNRRIRLSTRFLILFKIISYGVVGTVSLATSLVIMEGDWRVLLALINVGVIIFFAVKAIERLRTVTWEKKHVIKHRLDEIIIVPEEIKSIEPYRRARSHAVRTAPLPRRVFPVFGLHELSV